jgi:exosortase A-associated hydrolase 2
MLAAPPHPPAHPFFLDTDAGRRFCLYHRPRGVARGAVLLAPAFGEEMNKSRRMCALQARALAEAGWGVLQVDLYGCGDSEGDFLDARWEIWKADLDAALRWLRQECSGPLVLWGVRLGALLALDFARQASQLHSMLLWQPVTEGRAFLTQFLRLRLAADMLVGTSSDGGTGKLRQSLASGMALEIAGYDLSPELAMAIDTLDISHIAPPACPVHWFELLPEAGRQLPPGRARLIRHCAEAGWRIDQHVVAGPAFWTTQEITEAPALLPASVAALGAEGA